MKSLFEQMTRTEIEKLAKLLGFDKADAGFRVALMEIKPFKSDYTIEDAGISYCYFTLKKPKNANAERKAA